VTHRQRPLPRKIVSSKVQSVESFPKKRGYGLFW
jgi:hypothetical protein